MEKIRILFIGMGRMGLNHFAITNMLKPNAEIFFYEKSLFIRWCYSLNIKSLKQITSLDCDIEFDYVIISTPPKNHFDFLKYGLKAKKVLVEKPFGSFNDDRSMQVSAQLFAGYVLRFNIFFQKLKFWAESKTVTNVHINYKCSNGLKVENSWRNNVGVIEEIGCHALDYLFYLTNTHSDSQVEINKIEVLNPKGIINLSLNFKGVKTTMELNWLDETIRKPCMVIRLKTAENEILEADNQSLKRYHNSTEERIDLPSSAYNIPFYLRGIEHTRQLLDFYGPCKEICNKEVATSVRKLLDRINYEISTR